MDYRLARLWPVMLPNALGMVLQINFFSQACKPASRPMLRVLVGGAACLGPCDSGYCRRSGLGLSGS